MPDYSAFPLTDGVRTFLEKPDDYVVDFDNPQQHYHIALYAVVGVGNFITLLFLAQRLYTKTVLAKGLQLEDGFLLASWVCSLIVQSVTIWSVGIQARGVHAWEQPIERYVLFKISVYIGGSVFMPCASFAKIALLVFYLRLSPQTWFTHACWTTIGIIAVYTPAIFFALIFACKPVKSAWRVDIEGECIDTTALFIATCVVNTFTDLVLFLLPIPTVLKLRMPLAQKLGVLGLFSIGLVTVITSVVRAAILPMMSGPDQSWVTATASVWSQLECNLLVICGTIPTLKKFFRHIAPKLMGSQIESKTESNPNAPRSNMYRRKNPYSKFEDESTEFEMTRWEPPTSTTDDNHKGEISTTITTGAPRSKSEDDSSQKAIMETRSMEQHIERR